jgi:hypothetical protein
MAVLKRVCEDAPRPIQETNPEVPDSLVAMIARLHAKDPAQRFASADEVVAVLSKHLAHLQQPALATMPEAMPQGPRSGRGQWHARRPRTVAAALLLLLLGTSLGVSEATGVTRIAATVVRILTPDGTLVVEVEDPNIKVTIEGDGGLVITGAGPQEVRLRPGSYRVQAAMDGKPIQNDMVTITRGDKRVVRVSLELARLVAPRRQVGRKDLIIHVTSDPDPVALGEKTTVTVTVRSSDGILLPGVKVTIFAGGGKFLPSAETRFDPNSSLHGPFSTVGTTNQKGQFATWWVCNPGVGAYGVSVEAVKEGYTRCNRKHTIRVGP